MRKRIINQRSKELSPADQDWLDLERLAQVEITSEDEGQLIESALTTGAGPGWQASQPGEGQSYREILRQQYTFSPQGMTHEVEEYVVNLDGVSVLELKIVPDISGGDAHASLTQMRLA